ncbi:aldose 1-epimerase family protein [Aquimarina addita]|uniref:Aldose 1-epimerase family protein n=1 Tax=Aquimarina addita TaxID=870485 RepID=A0ABP6UM30_9FLAO
MIHSIENKKLSIHINSVGAELSSIKSKNSVKEFLWQGDPKIWGSQAPVLFPVVGGLKKETYIYKSKQYTLPKHGFIRYNQDLVSRQISDTSITFSLSSNKKTLLVYPFQFLFDINFELVDNRLKISHTIKNKGNEPMYFSVGGHPAFNCPLHSSHSYEDYYIQIDTKQEKPGSYILDKNGLISQNMRTVFQDDKIWLTSDLFNNDALIFKGLNAKTASLVHKTNGTVLMVDLSDFPDLGIWAKPNAPYVCIEPWLGYADVVETNQQIEDKEGIQKLEAGQTHTSSYIITIF